MSTRQVISIATSHQKGVRKKVVSQVELVVDHGIKGDAHAGPWHRQVSFLASESIEKVRQQGVEVSFGDFAENFATTGVDWKNIPIGTRVTLGQEAVVEITQIGKTCHKRCAIYYQTGDCIMPREGVFARVMAGGSISCGDAVELADFDGNDSLVGYAASNSLL